MSLPGRLIITDDERNDVYYMWTGEEQEYGYYNCCIRWHGSFDADIADMMAYCCS
jgi:hypothetical protein